ncbi:unnamed protein product [Rotaria sp. Silwood1]|nr:unnamed protein product [Rotaria sp. Silwood1]
MARNLIVVLLICTLALQTCNSLAIDVRRVLCSVPTFVCYWKGCGSTCQYRIEHGTTLSFSDIVQFIFDKCFPAPIMTDFIIGTCYPFLTGCYRSPSSICLDWREICDGDFDCINVEDEELCQILENGKEDCQHGEDEWDEYQRHLSKGNIPLALVCDGENDLKWTNISNETDETHCEWWPCNNPYFECDNRWYCLNGIDELNCSRTQCSLHEHMCKAAFGDEHYYIPVFHLIESYSNWTSPFFYRKIYLNNGYSGLQCNIEENCSCSLDSFCYSSSICVCSMNKYGPNCYLKHAICQSLNNPCENNGLCVLVDDRISINKFTCLCKKSFYGSRCENIKNRIYIKFNETISRTTAVFIHYIIAFENANHQRITTLRKINYDENAVTLFVTHPFHIIIGELFNHTYYLLILRERFIESEYIQTELISNQRCISIDELLNTTFRSYPRLHHIKYYPLLCRQDQ